MALPYFFYEDPGQDELQLPEDSSRHIAQVLRMKAGERLVLTNGKGLMTEVILLSAHHKQARARVVSRHQVQPPPYPSAIGLSLLKNVSRLEWFMEKATELGIRQIFPLLCGRTEKQKFRSDRMRNIMISALLQSRQAWLPELHEPMRLEDMMQWPAPGSRYIAHCMDGEKQDLSRILSSHHKGCLVLIGPEGDFTPGELSLAAGNGYIPVSLGSNRLRTETAAIAAAVLLSFFTDPAISVG